MHQLQDFFAFSGFVHGYQTVFTGHDVLNGFAVIVFKTRVATGYDTDQVAVFLNYREALKAVLCG